MKKVDIEARKRGGEFYGPGSPAAVLSIISTNRHRKALRVIWNIMFGGEALSRAESPAGPPKIAKSRGESTFPKI